MDRERPRQTRKVGRAVSGNYDSSAPPDPVRRYENPLAGEPLSPLVSPLGAPLSVNGDQQRVLKNVIVNYGAFFLQVALGIALAPALLRGLGNSEYGVLTLLGALASFVGIAELGLGTATARAIAAAGAREDEQEMKVVLSTSLVLYSAVAMIGILVLALLAILLPHLVVTSNVGEARLALLCLGSAQSIGLLLNVFPAVLFGSGRSSTLTTVGSIGAALGGVAQIVVVLTTGNLLATATVGAAVSVAGVLVIRHIARRSMPQLRLRRSAATKKAGLMLLSSGWRNAVIGLSATAAFSTDAVIVGALVSTSAVAAFGVAARACGIVGNLASRLSDVLVPTYAHYSTLEDSERIYSLYRDTVVGGLLMAIPAGAVAVTTGEGVLRLWLGQVPEGSASVLAILVTATVLAVPGAAAFRLLSGMNRLGFVAIAAAVAASVNVIIGVWATYQWGVIGPAIGTLITAIGYDLIVMPTYACRVLAIPYRRLARDLGWLLAPAAAALLCGYLVARVGTSTWAVLSRIAAVPLVYLVVVFFALGSSRRARYARVVRGRRTAKA